MKAEEQTPMEILFNELYDNRHSMFDRNSGQLKEEVKEKFLKLETEAIQQEREKWKEEAKQEVLEALQQARFNIETSDQYYLKTVKRHDYTLGFNKAQMLIVQQINELIQTKNRK